MRAPALAAVALAVPAVLAAFVVAAIASGCPPPAAECACPVEDPPCEQCAPIVQELCVDGACVARGADEVDVEATFQIARALEGVNGLAWAIADASAGESCPASRFDSFNGFQALAAGQKTLTGGDFHPDLGLARVPAGPVLVLALATAGSAGDGDIRGSGCVAAEAVSPRLDVELVNLE